MPPQAKKKRHAHGDRIIAASAGLDNWKTWSGRSHGSDGFELLDLVRGAKRSFNKRFVWQAPPPGTACPVCYVEPESPDEWHVTSSCGHSVCLDCLRAYAANQVADTSHVGPLKCPVCPLPLRESDAVRALENNSDVIRQWDRKIRDQLLRALPNYRHCPNCQKTDDSTGTEDVAGDAPSKVMGGGFVTPECLTPINSNREQHAEDLLQLLSVCEKMLIGAYFLYVVAYASLLRTSSVFVAVLNVYVIPAWLLHRLKLICYFVIAGAARRALFKPIAVECPCCNEAFILNAEAELSPNRNSSIGDKATAEWIGNNTRPCPSCSVPISKSAGCNHMRCSHCRASFCWACMRLRTRCAAYACRNGAPYGDSERNSSQEEDLHAGGIVERIERLERRATRVERRDVVGIFVLFTTIYCRDSAPVQLVSRGLVSVMSIVFSGGFVFTCVLLFILLRPLVVQLGQQQAGGQRPNQPRIQRGGAPGEAFLRRQEEAMLADALARSMREQ
mmetsp:Transcript_4402/g.8573  ORF Transcript_4402/g.8573 Transcript_4402/m.8573 type:complete len:503 (+) Transcript_4402:415-1923(+)